MDSERKIKAVCAYHSRRQADNRIARLLRANGVIVQEIFVNEGQALPKLDTFDVAISFGGTGGITANDDHLPAVTMELRWIEELLKHKVHFFGICFGAQLLARTLGGKVGLHPEGKAEVGYFLITPTELGKAIIPEPMYFYQWHRYGFDTPAGASQLATGDIFETQAISYDNALGVVFHPEATLDAIKKWHESYSHWLKLPGAQPSEQQLHSGRKYENWIEKWSAKFVEERLIRRCDHSR